MTEGKNLDIVDKQRNTEYDLYVQRQASNYRQGFSLSL